MATTLSERLFRRLHGRTMVNFAGLPGPSPTFPFGNALDFLKNKAHPWEVVEGYARAYGGMLVFWIGGTPVVALSDPALVARVLGEGAAGFYKDAPEAGPRAGHHPPMPVHRQRRRLGLSPVDPPGPRAGGRRVAGRDRADAPRRRGLRGRPVVDRRPSVGR